MERGIIFEEINKHLHERNSDRRTMTSGSGPRERPAYLIGFAMRLSSRSFGDLQLTR